MDNLDFPVIHDEKEGRTDVLGTPCLGCGRAINDKTYPQMITLTFSTIEMISDTAGGPKDEMKSAVFLSFFDFPKDGGATIMLAENIYGGEIDFCFCSTKCCRHWLNRAVDALEEKTIKLGFGLVS